MKKGVITSPDNKFYKLLKKLDKKKYRDENNIFKTEGEKFLNENINFNKIIIKESKYDYFNEKYGIDGYNNVTVLKDSLFDEISSQENSQGIVFLYSKNLNSIKDINGDVIILDDIQDPGNLGTIMRTMEAANFKNLILTRGSADVYNPKTVRAAMGGIFNLNIIYETPENIIKFLKHNNYLIITTALHENSVSYENINQKSKNAYIFGNEGGGVSEYFIENSDIKSIIPIYGNVESLNVSVAAGIFLYKMREKQEEKCLK
ncbi:MAG: RNA methyltransferase [Leptotrichiaceae bacterium]|nr:RNA methyltransferase [Leptotrichiaceae bacterium]